MDTLAMVRNTLKGIVGEQDIHDADYRNLALRRRSLFRRASPAPLTACLPEEWASQRERVARVRARLNKAGLGYAQHRGVAILINGQCKGDRRRENQAGCTGYLDLSIKEQFQSWGGHAVVPEIAADGEAAVLFKAPLADMKAWQGLPVLWRWRLRLCPSRALLRLHVATVDVCGAPGDMRSSIVFEAETFLDSGSSAYRKIIDALLEQEFIAVHFFDGEMGYRRSTRYKSHREDVPQVARMIQAGDQHLATLDVSQLDFLTTKSQTLAECRVALPATTTKERRSTS